MRGMHRVRLGLGGRLLPWLVSGALGLALFGGAGWFLATYPWVPFRPMCVIDGRHNRTLMENILPGLYRRIEGPLRPKFKDLLPRLEFEDYRVTPDGLYLTIDYYLDMNLYWNYQTRTLSSFESRELNPDAFDGYGNLDDDEL